MYHGEAMVPRLKARLWLILGCWTALALLFGAQIQLMTGVVHYSRLDVAAPVAVGIDAIGVAWGSLMVKVGAIADTSTVMLVTLLGQSRVFFSMSRDGLLPPWAGAIHPRFRTPWISSMITGIFVATFAGTIPISVLGQLVSIGTLLAFVIVCAAILILRKRRPDLERPFRTPLVPYVPILGILVFLLLMVSLASRYMDPSRRLASSRLHRLLRLRDPAQPLAC